MRSQRRHQVHPGARAREALRALASGVPPHSGGSGPGIRCRVLPRAAMAIDKIQTEQ
jgi:hypothetical protein